MSAPDWRTAWSVSILLALACSATATPTAVPWRTDIAAAIGEAADARRVAMVYVSGGEGEEESARLDTETFVDPVVVAILSEVVPVRVNAAGDGGAEPFLSAHSVVSLPAVVFLDCGGALLGRIVGFRAPEAFAEELDRILSGYAIADELASSRVTSPPLSQIEWTGGLGEALLLSSITGKPMMVSVYGDRCEWCAKVHEQVLTDPMVGRGLGPFRLPGDRRARGCRGATVRR